MGESFFSFSLPVSPIHVHTHTHTSTVQIWISPLLLLSFMKQVFERMVAWAKGSAYFKYDPNVTVAEVRNQVGGFADGIKAAAALAGEFGAGLGTKKEE